MSASAADKLPLSVLIRTRNEADRIAETIRSVLPFAGEVVVIDSGSTDATVEIAERLGARVVHNPWPGFGPQRNFGEGQCANDYIFSLDADEVATPEFEVELRALFASDPPPRLIELAKAMIFPHWKKPPPFGYAHDQVLIYDKRIARTGPNPNWDQLVVSGPQKTARIKAPIWHYSLRDWRHATEKLAYVAHLAARTQKKKPRWQLVLRVIFEFPLTFVKFYVMRRYFFGGVDGFMMAVVSAYGRWLRIAMMLERKDYPDAP